MSSWSSFRAAPAHQFPAAARRRARAAAARSARVRSGARLSHHASYRAATASRSGGLRVRASPRTSRPTVSSRTPRARAMRAEPCPITCRARSRSRVPPASRRSRGPVLRGARGWPKVMSRTAGSSVVISGDLLGLTIGLAGAAGGVEGAGDLAVAEAGLAGGGSQRAEGGGGGGVQGAVGGPVQAAVAIAFGPAGDPAGQLGERPVRIPAWRRGVLVPLGFQEP